MLDKTLSLDDLTSHVVLDDRHTGRLPASAVDVVVFLVGFFLFKHNEISQHLLFHNRNTSQTIISSEAFSFS
jgi:hypothetical protein